MTKEVDRRRGGKTTLKSGQQWTCQLNSIVFSIAFVLIVLFVYIVHCKVGLKEE